MDSLTQASLGAAVGVAVMGRRTAAWKAALWGAAMGTLPDLDVVFDFGDPIRNMTEHRAESHALFYQLLAAPLLTLLVARPRLRHPGMPLPVSGSAATSRPWANTFDSPSGYGLWTLATALILITHALLDGMTVYGTQLWLPFYNEAVGLGSVFIIDPLYTLPLLLGLFASLITKKAWGFNSLKLGLLLSSLYLVWSAAAQAWVERTVQAQLPESRAALLVTPSAFNTVLWRLVAITDTHYYEGWYSLLADGSAPVRWRALPRDPALYDLLKDNPSVARLARFSDGFFHLERIGDKVVMTDLRMGQEPAYVFRFDIGSLQPTGELSGPVERPLVQRPPLREGLAWLWQRTWGRTDLDLIDWIAAKGL
ncbi:MAG: metal-dependent hydrolase [Burkholderiaceae bacterium]